MTSAPDVVELHASIGGEPEQEFVGRFAWCLAELIKACAKGCTPIEQPAPRWSHYVFRLRRAGVDIETVGERHGGAYSGVHARYVLRSAVHVVRMVREGERHAA